MNSSEALENVSSDSYTRDTNNSAKHTNSHPYSYFRKEGDPLRPAPERVKNNPAWYDMRKFLLDGLRPVGKYSLPTMPGDYPQRLNDLYWEGDELMDNVVLAMKKMKAGEGRIMFDKALKQGIDTIENPPEEFIALFKQLDHIPDWLDWDVIDAGGAYYSNFPFWAIGIGAFLPTLYTTHGYATSIPVGATGRMIRQKVNRMIEGVTFVAATSSPGGLHRFSYGFECAVHIRLMHSFVRNQMYTKNGDLFNYATDGDPMSQPDTLVGISVFGISNLLVAKSFGVDYTDEQINSVNMLWKYVVYLMGGNQNGMPKDVEESLYLLDYYIATQGKPSKYTDELNKCVFLGIKETVKERSPAWQRPLIEFVFTDFVGSFLRHMAGDELSDEVKYVKKPNIITKQLPTLLRAWTKVNTLRGKYRPNDTWDNRLAVDGSFLMGYKKLMRAHKSEEKVTFKAHDKTTAKQLDQKTQYSS